MRFLSRENLRPFDGVPLANRQAFLLTRTMHTSAPAEQSMFTLAPSMRWVPTMAVQQSVLDRLLTERATCKLLMRECELTYSMRLFVGLEKLPTAQHTALK